jgi:hypothetical protein
MGEQNSKQKQNPQYLKQYVQTVNKKKTEEMNNENLTRLDGKVIIKIV